MSKRQADDIGIIEFPDSKRIEIDEPVIIPEELEEKLEAQGYLSEKYLVNKYLKLAYFSKTIERDPVTYKKVQTIIRKWIEEKVLCLRICEFYSTPGTDKRKIFGGSKLFHSIQYFRGDILIGYVAVPATVEELLAQVDVILPVKGEFVQPVIEEFIATTIEFDIIRGVHCNINTLSSLFTTEYYPEELSTKEIIELQRHALRRAYMLEQ